MSTAKKPVYAKVVAASLGAIIASVVAFLATAGIDVQGEADKGAELLVRGGTLLSGVIGAFVGGYSKTETTPNA